MKRILTSFLLFLPVLLFADRIDRRQAQTLAEHFLGRQQRTTQLQSRAWQGPVPKSSGIDLELVDWENGIPGATKSSATPELYLFNNRGGRGYVLIAGDDTAVPVLGYSLDGQLSAASLPLNFRNWLSSLSGEIRKARELGLKPDAAVRRQWEALSAETAPAGQTGDRQVIRFYETAAWDQGAPYYNECPKYGLSRTYAGCVMTATAIVMRHHQWPERAHGITPAYTTEKLKIEVPERDLNHEYDWKLLPLHYFDGSTPIWTPQEAAEIAKLIADLGAAFQADYGTENEGGTGASLAVIPEMLVRYWDYDRSIHSAYRFEHTMPEWIKRVRHELNLRPVVYGGRSDAGGHAFVLDGYDDHDFFHVNWGWSGDSDGWFLLTALDPSQQGAGGSGGAFNVDQTAIFNMKPDGGGAPVDLVTMIPYEYKNDLTGEVTTYEGIVSTPEKILPGAAFDLVAGGIYSSGLDNFTGQVSFCWTDYEGKIKKHLGEQEFTLREPLEIGYIYGLELTDIMLDGKIEQGDRIKLFYKSRSMADWVPVLGAAEEGFTYELELPYEPLDPDQRLDRLVAFVYDKEAARIVLEIPEKVTAEFLDPTGKSLADRVETEAGKVVLPTGNLPHGTYKIVLRRGLELKELAVKL